MPTCSGFREDCDESGSGCCMLFVAAFVFLPVILVVWWYAHG